MKNEDLLRQALDIDDPWHIVRIRNDLGKRQIDIWVGREVRKTWFFAARSDTLEPNERVWRHINIGNARCLVHAVVPPGEERFSLQWLGDDGQTFTRSLVRQIGAMLKEGISLQAICSLLDIPVTDLWKLKHGFDSGKTGLPQPTGLPDDIQASADLMPGEQSVVPATRVPPPDSPLWEQLLDGTVNLDIRALSLKLLLTKLREHYAVISDSEVRVLKSHELQRYFVRHEKLLGHELAQLQKH